jgi:hypothetical protein
MQRQHVRHASQTGQVADRFDPGLSRTFRCDERVVGHHPGAEASDQTAGDSATDASEAYDPHR